MEIYGIVGKKLSHSYSPGYFRDKFTKLNIFADYLTFEIDDISNLPELIRSMQNLVGFNVTIPYKEAILPYLKHLSKEAKLTGSVNTVKIKREEGNPDLWGYNTDVFGFRTSIVPIITGKKDLRAIILGTGGSAKTIAFVLHDLGIPYISISRTPKKNELAYSDITARVIAYHNLIINTTPLGMYPDVNSFPDIPYKSISNQHILFDLVYNPEVTKFMEKGREQHATVVNGQKMLQAQAEESWNIWQQ